MIRCYNSEDVLIFEETCSFLDLLSHEGIGIFVQLNSFLNIMFFAFFSSLCWPPAKIEILFRGII